jgi:hypothetical protein
MNDLPMPSDHEKPADKSAPAEAKAEEIPLAEPPSAKLLVRLFLIPLIIVAVAVGIMFLIGLLAGRPASFEEALARLKRPGGGRTADMLVGPGAKQRYIDAKTLVDKMKAGMTEPERIAVSKDLIDLLDNHTQEDEGDVRHFLLLATGRVWQIEPRKSGETDEQFADRQMNSEAAVESRKDVVEAVLRYMDSPTLRTRTAAVLSTAYWTGRPEAKLFVPKLIAIVKDGRQDLDVRMAAATALGPIGSFGPERDPAIIDALQYTLRNADPRDQELVWSAALSLAQMDQKEVDGTILSLLDRQYLSDVQVYDREVDPKNPKMRKLSDAEQQRFLINTMIGAKNLKSSPEVQAKIGEITKNDPSPRVRAQGIELGYGSK